MHPKPVSASRVTLAHLMQPTEANAHGNVHGGFIMKLMDEAGGAASMRHAQRPVVTVVVDQVLFRGPIHVGDLVTFQAELTYAGRTSMEARIEVVALDDAGHPTEVPPLLLETEAERRQWEAAKERQAYRLAQRNKEQKG